MHTRALKDSFSCRLWQNEWWHYVSMILIMDERVGKFALPSTNSRENTQARCPFDSGVASSAISNRVIRLVLCPQKEAATSVKQTKKTIWENNHIEWRQKNRNQVDRHAAGIALLEEWIAWAFVSFPRCEISSKRQGDTWSEFGIALCRGGDMCCQ